MDDLRKQMVAQELGKTTQRYPEFEQHRAALVQCFEKASTSSPWI